MSSSKWKFQVQNIKNVDLAFLDKVDKSINECFYGKFNPGPMWSYQLTVKQRDVHRELVTLEEANKIIFSCITSSSRPDTIRLSTVCIPRAFRAKKQDNVFDYALECMKAHYKKQGIRHFELEAEKEPFEGLTQKLRIYIYGKRGFYIHPKSELFGDDEEKKKMVKTRILMGKEHGTILSMPTLHTYRVKMDTGEIKTVQMKDIDYCIAPDNTPLHCQMMLDLYPKQKTRKQKS